MDSKKRLDKLQESKEALTVTDGRTAGLSSQSNLSALLHTQFFSLIKLILLSFQVI